ncbi:MAG: PAS domain-containing protein [Tagaea sp.]
MTTLTSADYRLEPFDTATWHARPRAVYAHWRGLPRTNGPLPARGSFDAFAVPGALGWLWLHDVERAPFRLRSRLFGSLLAQCVGTDITGEYLDARPLVDAGRPLDIDRLRASAIDGRPTWTRKGLELAHGQSWAEVESLILPFAADGHTPDMVLGVSTYYRSDGSVV